MEDPNFCSTFEMERKIFLIITTVLMALAIVVIVVLYLLGYIHIEPVII